CGSPLDSPCGESLECVRGLCRCRWTHAVCGTDGHTYANVCALQAASRRALQLSGTPVRQLQKGACPLGLRQLSSPRYKFNFIADVVEKIAPAVVHIELFLRHPLFGRNVPLSSGSGFIMSEAGLIITNAHVVSSNNAASGRQQLKVQLQNGDSYEATIKDIDKKSDIATIKIHPKVGGRGRRGGSTWGWAWRPLPRCRTPELTHQRPALRPPESSCSSTSCFRKALVSTYGYDLSPGSQHGAALVLVCTGDLPEPSQLPGEQLLTDAGSPYLWDTQKAPLCLLGWATSADLRPGEFGSAHRQYLAPAATRDNRRIRQHAQRDGPGSLGLGTFRHATTSRADASQSRYGNSGGPLVNLDGEVIGINTLKVTAGISFAIPSDRITRFLTEFQDKQIKDWKKRFIGIRMRTITPSLVDELKASNPDFPEVSSGIYVQEVAPNSPSQRGGIQDGDIIVKVNGRPLVDSSELQEAVLTESPLLLEVRRGNDDLLFSIAPEVVM
ncbi:PREDICTED: serine protease HTRA3, partial [Rhinopithecus bieti]|uniref:serine protease HTRA3 n=1 Tax=Rhinopithecus bieti TaxID=61621 RepID=UPI00083C6177